MKKVFLNPFFILATVLAVGLSAYSFVAYKSLRAGCSLRQDCCKVEKTSANGEMLWDVFFHQFVSTSASAR
jgi:hypothetical protein